MSATRTKLVAMSWGGHRSYEWRVNGPEFWLALSASALEPTQVELYRPAPSGANPVFPGQMHGRDLCKSGLGQEVPVLCIAQECGLEQPHYDAV